MAYKGRKIILIAPAFNEGEKIGEVVKRTPRGILDKILVVDDGSTDQTAAVARNAGAEVVSLGASKGVGFAIASGFNIALAEDFDIAVVIAGNNKDNPQEINRLLDPICEEDYDFVIGSRFLSGGGYGGGMPFYRKLATRFHPFLVGFFCGKKITESTNGYRAIKTAVLKDQRINLHRSWLHHYELEVYLLMKLLKLGFKTTEVPVTKIYPPKNKEYTKMRPVLDWWKMLSPVFLVGTGIRK
jgi:dolichol-phosphate mannosyltransferase